jgi:hypothetical protein
MRGAKAPVMKPVQCHLNKYFPPSPMPLALTATKFSFLNIHRSSIYQGVRHVHSFETLKQKIMKPVKTIPPDMLENVYNKDKMSLLSQYLLH